MRIVLIDDRGTIYEILEKVEEYDLTKGYARSVLGDMAVWAIRDARKDASSRVPSSLPKKRKGEEGDGDE